jgi:excisionase family DNA binding protein
MSPVTAPEEQQAQVEALSRALENIVRSPSRGAGRLQLVGPRGKSVNVPESVVLLLERVAEVLARGDAISLVPVSQEITTTKAAEILNVSRQYLVRLLGEGRIPFRMTGKHRRLRVGDVLAYKARRDRDRKAALRQLSRLTQRYGGYDAEVR